MGQYINPEIKQTIITSIRDNGVAVTDAAHEYGISTKTIYRWLREGVQDGQQNLVLENNRLKKENEQLYAMLGKATAMLQRPKR